MATKRQRNIEQTFRATCDEFPDKSTEFCLQMTAERTGADYSQVVDSLAAIHAKDGA